MDGDFFYIPIDLGCKLAQIDGYIFIIYCVVFLIDEHFKKK